MSDIEMKFNKEMKNIYIRAKEEEGYQANYFLQMLDKYGGVQTAKKLLISKEAQSGFYKLMDLGREDLTVEALILKEEYKELFTPEELKIARERIRNYKFNFKNINKKI